MLLSAQMLFAGHNPKQTKIAVLNGDSEKRFKDALGHVSEQGKSFLRSCLIRDPRERQSCE